MDNLSRYLACGELLFGREQPEHALTSDNVPRAPLCHLVNLLHASMPATGGDPASDNEFLPPVACQRAFLEFITSDPSHRDSLAIGSSARIIRYSGVNDRLARIEEELVAHKFNPSIIEVRSLYSTLLVHKD